MNGRINLEQAFFGEKEQILCELNGMKASTFRYSSGVHALRVANPRGHIVVLPYQGQQIWDAVFEGRRLTMTSLFPEPAKSPLLMDSYGAFLYHCGARRMGTPAPEDDHPLHGELPAATYDTACILLGEDEGGRYLGVSGTYLYAKAFGDKYRATPTVKLYEKRAMVDVGMAIENLTHHPMDLMYMCHVNFLPAENGEIVQAAGWNTTDMSVRSSIPSHVKPTPQYLAFLDALRKDPGVTRVFRPEDHYDPEIVFYLRNLRMDAQGNTHVIQKHPNGSADYIGYNAKTLNHTVRWILKHPDQKVAGIALPATCDPEGYVAEKKKGNVRTLPGLGTAEFALRAGYLDAAEAQRMESEIRSL